MSVEGLPPVGIIDSFTLRAYQTNALEVSMSASPEQAVSVSFRQSAFAAFAVEVFPLESRSVEF